MNKKAAGEGFSWAAGLIVIALIVIFAVFFSIAGKFGQKSIIIGYDSNIYSSESQRIAAYSLLSDFNSSKKGNILSEIYLYTNFASSVLVNFPSIPLPKDYSYNAYPSVYESNFARSIYLHCSHSPTKYISFWLMKGSSNGK